jgi:hypothetical protein
MQREFIKCKLSVICSGGATETTVESTVATFTTAATTTATSDGSTTATSTDATSRYCSPTTKNDESYGSNAQ